MANYWNGKIYMIKCNKTNLIYIGSTTLTLEKRLNTHEQDAVNISSGLSSKIIILNGDYQIILIENYPCLTKQRLLMREQAYIDKCDCVNKNKAYISENEKKLYQKEYQKDWREFNKEKKKADDKVYRDSHKEYQKEYQKAYREFNKEYRKAYRSFL